jgi:formylmethanofuran dehydrogenase subunit A
MKTLRLAGGRIVDPAHGIDGEVRDLYIRDGRIVSLNPGEQADETIDVSGCIVMAGGIDLHTHIGGGKMNLARVLLPEDHRRGLEPIEGPENTALQYASCGTCTPGTLATGYKYIEMGYTSAFEPAMPASNARQTHLEMGDIPVLDHGAYVLMGNDELLLRMLAEGTDFERIRDYVAWTVNATKALGVKVVNPGGISAFKYNQRKLDVDEGHAHWQVTPRQIIHTLARALTELGMPHPLHIHTSNLGAAGNIASTLATIDALDGLPGHLTHIQFHSYGTEGKLKFSSAAVQLAEAVNAHPNVTVDVGQVMFAQTVTASADTMRQHTISAHGSPRKWVMADIECEAGCGVLPFRYREQSYVNALQWTIGLELFLLITDPWRVVLTTDHPNGGPFGSYPHLIRLLMDKSFRDEQLATLHPDVAANSPLKQIARELSLYEVAILTRAGPARLLGLKDKGRLGDGAVADIAVYRPDAKADVMFATPAYVFKDGVLVARDGKVTAVPTGGTHYAEPEYDKAIEKVVDDYAGSYLTVNPRHAAIGRDELCACCNGGRLLPTACFAEAQP